MIKQIYLSDKQVGNRYGVKRGTVWRWTKEITAFPKPVKLSPGCARWSIADLESYEKTRHQQNDCRTGKS